MTSPSASVATSDTDDFVRAARAGARGRTVLVNALRLGTLAAFLVLWEIASRRGWVDPLFASSPSKIVEKLVEMIGDGSLWPHVAATSYVAAMGFGLAVIVGVPLGILMGRSELFNATAEPFVAAIYASPQVAFLPLLIIWLGIGFASKVALVFIGSVIIMVINTETGVAQVDRRLVETARSFTASEAQILTMIVLPAALPFILAGMRLAVGRALVMVVVAEIYASNRGLGYMIFQAGGL
jgi:ABC-type nitrate/sulfonate/bicarbonate transport system permease component